ncbi:MAG: hypothetical protein BWK80_56505 [Desulfobacteraceae bacterium IS3]|jgi:hypothetical protein|nr:MAG: hypothetical protein BWK80_56505 [Desulfobacteraceae bacterium IS3]HAO22652.1 hypothetical protein [Desulfobacteraceae bacterium]
MEKEELWRKFNMLPSVAQREILDFFDFMHVRYGQGEQSADADKKFMVPPPSDGKNGRHFSFSKGMGHQLGTRVDTETELPADRRFKL